MREPCVFDPITDKPHEKIKLSDLLGVELTVEGKIIYAKQPFYWEKWNLDKDSSLSKTKNGQKYIEYKFNIKFSKEYEWKMRIEIGDVMRMPGNKAIFSRMAEFKGATFSGWANFGGATFSRGASFGDATFSGKAEFVSTRFSDMVSFQNVTFEQVLDLNEIAFNSNRSAKIFIDLSGCTVKNKILFIYDSVNILSTLIPSSDYLIATLRIFPATTMN